MRLNLKFLLAFLIMIYLTGCEEFLDRFQDLKARQTQVTDFATGLQTPFGIEVDAKKQVWVNEAGAGTGNNGRLSLFTPEGIRYTVVEGFSTGLSPEGTPYGLTDLLLQDGILWILHGGAGRLYRFDINDFAIGDEPIDAGDLEYEEVGAFVLSYPFEDQTGETNLFKITTGPGGDLFMTDAGQNAVIRRAATTGALSVFAVFPNRPNTSGVGPPTIDVVPTGIVYDGHSFFVSSLTGFPFLSQFANIYKVDQAGNYSVYQTGFTTLTDIEIGPNRQLLATEFGTFTGTEFAPNSGRVVLGSGSRISPVVSDVFMPTTITKGDAKTFYYGSSFDGKIKKLVYQ
jgi:hypothetical protein